MCSAAAATPARKRTQRAVRVDAVVRGRGTSCPRRRRRAGVARRSRSAPARHVRECPQRRPEAHRAHQEAEAPGEVHGGEHGRQGGQVRASARDPRSGCPATPRRSRRRPRRRTRAPTAARPSRRKPAERQHGRAPSASARPGASTWERRMLSGWRARGLGAVEAVAPVLARERRTGCCAGCSSAPISGRQRIRPPPPRMRAASSESWSLCHSSCQPPWRSSVARGQTPVKPLSTSISSSEACRNSAPPVPSRVSSASATRRDQGPSPWASWGPLTWSAPPRRRRATPRAR